MRCRLKRIAHRQLRRGGHGDTLQTTALVHEVYVRLAGPALGGFHDRVHFLAVAARAMRRILVDRARPRDGQAWRRRAAVELDIERAAGPRLPRSAPRRPLRAVAPLVVRSLRSLLL